MLIWSIWTEKLHSNEVNILGAISASGNTTQQPAERVDLALPETILVEPLEADDVKCVSRPCFYVALDAIAITRRSDHASTIFLVQIP